jgi:hypothetical protein
MLGTPRQVFAARCLHCPLGGPQHAGPAEDNVKIRRVSAALLEPSKTSSQRPLSARELRRRALERDLEAALRRADGEPQAAFKIDLEEGDKAPTIRLAFLRVRQHVGLSGVNLFSRDGALFMAKRPQTRGRGRRGGRPGAA